MSLATDIESYTISAAGPSELYQLIGRCLSNGGATGLAGLRRLAEADYGGITFKFELQSPAAAAMVLFAEDGLSELTNLAISDLESRNAVHAMELLASIASGPTLPPLSFVQSSDLRKLIEDYLATNDRLQAAAMGQLCRIVLAYENDDEVALRVGSAMSNLTTSTSPAPRALFDALAGRWLVVSTPVLERYENLMVEKPSDEPTFQSFLTEHPHLLDPFAVEVWPEPDLFGFKAPDFIVRRADDTYVVVEIECPSKSLITKSSRQPTEEVIHAITQVTEYEGYLMRKYSDLAVHFPAWSPPDLLVVCGLERDLDDTRRDILRNYNRRAGARVVGFDWLANRARTVSRNFLRGAVSVRSGLRLV